MSETLIAVLIGGIFGFLGGLLAIIGNAIIDSRKVRYERLNTIRERLIGDRIQTAEIVEFVQSQRKRIWPRFWEHKQPDLSHADLQEASLFGADLAGTNLYRANLQDAVLMLANLQGCFLHRAVMREAILREVDLSGADLVEADLKGANLYKAKLDGADLTDADLTGANLNKASLVNTDLDRTILVNSRLFYADLRHSRFRRTNLKGAILQYALLNQASFEETAVECDSKTVLPDGSSWHEGKHLSAFSASSE